MLVLLIVCLSLAALGLVVSNAQRRASERKFCDITEFGVQQIEQQVKAYEDRPPSTEAGRAQQQLAVEALMKYRQLNRSLGCDPVKQEKT